MQISPPPPLPQKWFKYKSSDMKYIKVVCSLKKSQFNGTFYNSWIIWHSDNIYSCVYLFFLLEQVKKKKIYWRYFICEFCFCFFTDVFQKIDTTCFSKVKKEGTKCVRIKTIAETKLIHSNCTDVYQTKKFLNLTK